MKKKKNNLIKYKKSAIILSKNKLDINLKNIEAPMPARESIR